ncbi:MAG: glycyl-radical enzyme activating protein [Clostridiales bacterium]|nr:glycyl-radical enzyme activating protein [Clostridiales bacterium]
MTKIRYLDIQRMSSEDGPGLRTTVFFKGCSLACAWCHNPESIAKKFQVHWLGSRCIGCGSCETVCPNDGLSRDETGVHIDRRLCTGCCACVSACPTLALECKGIDAEPEELCRELVKDRAYFGRDGGVTLSGGEALLQDGAVELLRLLKAEGIQTAVDTCGMVFTEQLQAALPYTDILLYDLKLMNDAEHTRWTGRGNAMILRNLGAAALWAKGSGRLWIRTPVIPGATDSEANIRAIGERIRAIGCAERWELCAFNNLCTDKYKRLDIDWTFMNTPLVSRRRMEELLAVARSTRACEDIRATGALSEEE